MSVEEKLLAKVLPELNPDYLSIRYIQGGRQVVYEVMAPLLSGKGRPYIVIGEQKGEEFDEIFINQPHLLDADPVYWAKKNGKQFIVRGTTKGPAFDDVDHFPKFSAGRRRMAYRAKEGELEFVVVDGSQGACFNKVRHITFSPNGEKVAYAAKQGDRECIVVNDQRGESYEEVDAPVFSPQGDQLAYRAKRNDEWLIVLGNRTFRPHSSGVAHPYDFTPDGKQLVYIEYASGKERVVVGDKKGKEFDRIRTLRFGPDNQVVYKATRGSMVLNKNLEYDHAKECVVIGEKEGEEFDWVGARSGIDEIGDPVVSPDGKQVAYAAKKAGQWFVVVGDRKGAPFKDVGQPVFSPDGKRVAYTAEREDQFFLVVDDRELFLSKRTDEVCSNPAYWIQFTPDSRDLCYVVRCPDDPSSSRLGSPKQLVVSKRKSPILDDVSYPYFSPDGKKVGFGVRKGRELWWKVMDVRNE